MIPARVRFVYVFRQISLVFYIDLCYPTYGLKERNERLTGTMEAVVYIGDNLKRVRTLRALTQVELADKAGVTPSTVVLIEGDKTEPHMSTIRKLARALDVDPAELVRGPRDA